MPLLLSPVKGQFPGWAAFFHRKGRRGRTLWYSMSSILPHLFERTVNILPSRRRAAACLGEKRAKAPLSSPKRGQRGAMAWRRLDRPGAIRGQGRHPRPPPPYSGPQPYPMLSSRPGEPEAPEGQRRFRPLSPGRRGFSPFAAGESPLPPAGRFFLPAKKALRRPAQGFLVSLPQVTGHTRWPGSPGSDAP